MTTNPPLRLLTACQEHFDSNPALMIDVPGREMWVAADIGQGHAYTIITPDLDGRTIFDRRSAIGKQTIRNRPLPRWARSLAGVILVLSDDGFELPGATVLMVGDEPPGPRYEYALGVAFSALWYEFTQLPYDIETLLDVVDRAQKLYPG